MRQAIRGLFTAALAVTVLSGRAEAAPITIGGDSSQSFEIVWSQMVGSVELRATGVFDVVVTDSYADFTIRLTNEMAASFNEKIHSIGFNTNPNATSLTNIDPGQYFDYFRLNTNFPSFQRIDICMYTANNCTGGAQHQNLPGQVEDEFGFRLNGNFSNGITLDTFAIQFMGDLGSFQFEGEEPPPRVPEPGSALLVFMGLGSLVASRRRVIR